MTNSINAKTGIRCYRDVLTVMSFNSFFFNIMIFLNNFYEIMVCGQCFKIVSRTFKFIAIHQRCNCPMSSFNYWTVSTTALLCSILRRSLHQSSPSFDHIHFSRPLLPSFLKLLTFVASSFSRCDQFGLLFSLLSF